MKDRNVPTYSHGGGKVDISEIKVIKENETNFGKYKFVIEPGKFKYKSPCPPGGKHVYEWSAVAKDETLKLETGKFVEVVDVITERLIVIPLDITKDKD